MYWTLSHGSQMAVEVSAPHTTYSREREQEFSEDFSRREKNFPEVSKWSPCISVALEYEVSILKLTNGARKSNTLV